MIHIKLGTALLVVGLAVTCCAAEEETVPAGEKELREGLGRFTWYEKNLDFMLDELIRIKLNSAKHAALEQEDLEKLDGLVKSQADIPAEAVTNYIKKIWNIEAHELRDFGHLLKTWNRVFGTACEQVKDKIGSAAETYEQSGDKKLIKAVLVVRVCGLLMDMIESGKGQDDSPVIPMTNAIYNIFPYMQPKPSPIVREQPSRYYRKFS